MKAIFEACKTGRIAAEGALLVAPSEEIPAVSTAREMEAEVAILNHKDSRFGEELLAVLAAERIDLLCLAGFLRLLPSDVVQALEGSILNIHPALLPKFGGKGMYGMRVHEAAIDSGDKESGASVHFVNEKYDEGDIFLQMKCSVLPDDTPESLAKRVLKVEHECYVEAIRKWIRERRAKA